MYHSPKAPYCAVFVPVLSKSVVDVREPNAVFDDVGCLTTLRYALTASKVATPEAR